MLRAPRGLLAKVPAAVENTRQGRPLDYSSRKPKRDLTPEQRTEAVAKALEALTKALDAIQSDDERSQLAAGVVQAMQAYLLNETSVGEGSTP